jgi:hypothetical protein
MQKRTRQVWCAPTPLWDTTHNPWPEDKLMPIVDKGVKVAFRDEGHQYYLQDGEYAYPDLIISCSKLVKYWDECLKVLNCGDETCIDVAVSVKQKFEQSNTMFSKPIYVRPDSQEGSEAKLLRVALTRYFNTFLEWNNNTPTYNQRQSRVDSFIPNKQKESFRNFLRHAVIRDIEVWLMCKDEPSFTSTHGDMIFLLRYLRCPDRGFSDIQATNNAGEHLSAHLALKLETFGPQPVLTQAELKLIDRSMGAFAGTIAHSFIERTIDPSRGELPELREREDMVAIKAMLNYLREKDIWFEKENIERRVGSMIYKLSGSMDGIRRCSDDTFEIWDWKRTKEVHEWIKISTRKSADDPYWLICDFEKVNFSTSLMCYFIQAAGYHQLETISNKDRVVRTSAFLGVFHPSLEQGFVIIEMDLSKKMRAGALKTTKGIGNLVDHGGEVVECTEGMTSIEYVQCLMSHRLRHLEQHFKCKPCLT